MIQSEPVAMQPGVGTVAPNHVAGVRRHGPRLWLLAVPALVLLGCVFVAPLFQMLNLSLSARGIENYASVLRDDAVLTVLGRTFWISATVTLTSLFLGYPVAYLMLRSSDTVRYIVALLIVLPLWTSILVRTYAWIVILGRQGIVNKALMWIGATDQPLTLLYNRSSMMIGMIHIMLPFMVLPLYAVMQRIDLRLLPAAATLGAGRTAGFLLVFLPLSMPGVLAGSLLVFILSIGFFVTPALLGGLRETTYVMLIEQQVSKLLNWPLASAMSIILLLATLVLVLVYNRVLANGALVTSTMGRVTLLAMRLLRVWMSLAPRFLQMESRTGVRATPGAKPRKPPKERHLLVKLLGWTVVFFIVAPILIIFPLAFSSAPYLAFPPPGYSLRWFANYFSRMDWITPTITSFEVAAVTTILATVLGTMASVALVRSSFPGKKAALGLILAPMILPTVIVALGLYAIYAKLGLIGTRTGLVLAHTVLAIPYVVVVVSAALQRVDPALEQAAWTMGASRFVAFRRITLPLIKPGILTAALFAFVASFDEVVVAIFVAGTTATTLPKRMWDGIREEIDPTIAAVATLLVCLSLAAMGLTELLRRRAKARGAATGEAFIR